MSSLETAKSEWGKAIIVQLAFSRMYRIGSLALFLFWAAITAGCDSADDTEDGAPAVTADEVVDRATLKTFVQEAARFYVQALEDHSEAEVDRMFREEGGYWKSGDIYIYVLDRKGTILFHAGNKANEGRNLYDLADANGVRYTRDLIAAADQGGGYVEYLFDNPAIDGDEESGSPKVGYAELFTASNLNGGQPSVIGSGFYP